MPKFEIFKNSVENSSVILKAKKHDISRNIYKHLTSGKYDDCVNKGTAIDIANWCESAKIGEDYVTDDVTVIAKK